MANVHYKVVDDSMLTVKGKTYIAQTFNMPMQEFLKAYAGKDLYIYRDSIGTDKIRAVVIDTNRLTWEEIHEEYSREEYPPFGGPFTDAKSPWEWLNTYFEPPKRKEQ